MGCGWSVAGRLRELSSRHTSGAVGHSAEIVDVNFATSSSEPGRFINLRAEVWWQVGREYSRTGRWDLSSVSDETLTELASPRYQIMDSQGKIKIQAKDELRSKLGRSPDSADALLLAFWGDQLSARVVGRGSGAVSLA
jgi:hypothetical protein